MRGPEFFSEIEVEARGATLTEALLLALMGAMPSQSWFSLSDTDGKPVTGGFWAGINLPSGTVALTLPISLLRIVENTGASLLPRPFGSVNLSSRETVEVLLKFATR